MKKTMIVWRRLGKEHGEEAGYQVNPDEVVRQHLEEKLNRFHQTDEVDWKWYIHIGSTKYDKSRSCWLFTDWFSDVLVKTDNESHSVLDLHELAQGYELGLITREEMSETLIATQKLVDAIRDGEFPPRELEAWDSMETVMGT